MFGTKTKVEDVVKWRRVNRIDAITRALSDQDPAVRAAAATALEQVDTSEVGTKRDTLDSAAAALVVRLDDETDSDVLPIVVSALGNLGTYARPEGDGTTYSLRPETIRPLITTMNRTDDVETRKAAARAIERILLVKNSKERVKGCLAVFPLLAHGQGLTRETVDDLLGVLASVYVWAFKASGLETQHEWEASPLGRAFVECGPSAGKALIQVGTRLHDSNAVAFGARIVEGSAPLVNNAHSPDAGAEEQHDYEYVGVLGSGGHWVCTTCGHRPADDEG